MTHETRWHLRTARKYQKIIQLQVLFCLAKPYTNLPVAVLAAASAGPCLPRALAPVFGIHARLSALKERGESLRPVRAGKSASGKGTRGVAPGWHPPRRWRGAMVSRGGDSQKAIHGR